MCTTIQIHTQTRGFNQVVTTCNGYRPYARGNCDPTCIEDLALCTGLNWLEVSFWAHVNITIHSFTHLVVFEVRFWDFYFMPSVLWHCWLGIRTSIQPVRCWRGYLSGVRCRLFAYSPADAAASQNPIISCLIQIQIGFTCLVPAYPGCPGKEAVKWVS